MPLKTYYTVKLGSSKDFGDFLDNASKLAIASMYDDDKSKIKTIVPKRHVDNIVAAPPPYVKTYRYYEILKKRDYKMFKFGVGVYVGAFAIACTFKKFKNSKNQHPQ
jgi:hypothetical protein